jgi:hypothetical protein
MGVDGAGLDGGGNTPYVLKETSTGLNAALPFHQILEEAIFQRGERDLVAIDVATVLREVQTKESDDQLRRQRFALNASLQQGLDAPDEFSNAERFAQIAVCAGGEAFNAVGFFVFRSEHENRDLRGVRLAAQCSAQLHARDVGKHDVENDDIGTMRLDELQRIGAVMRDESLEASLSGVERNERGEVGFVVDDEYSGHEGTSGRCLQSDVVVTTA